MNYLFYEKETDTRAKIMLAYHVKPPHELLDGGNYITIQSVPKPEQVKGKTALPYCNPQTGEFWYEYIDVPPTEEEITHERLQALEIAMAEILGV